VDPDAEVHPQADIGPYAIIQGPARIGANTELGPFSVVLGNTDIGPNCRIHSHAVVGDLPQDRVYQGESTGCVIGEGTIIREGATVHRGTGTGTATTIGQRCYLMTNSHVGHNCVLEDDVTLVSGALLAGHVHVGQRAIISGNAAVHQFCRIGELAMIGGLSKITKDIPPFMMTDQLGEVVGINFTGMRRGGYTPQQRVQIRHAFQVIYRSGLSASVVIETLLENNGTGPMATLIGFLQAPGARGLARSSTH